MAKRKSKSETEIERKARHRIVPIELSLVGSSDGVPVELTGHGKFDASKGRLNLELRVSRSLLLFDPAPVAISLLDDLGRGSLDRQGRELDARRRNASRARGGSDGAGRGAHAQRRVGSGQR